MYKVVPGTCRWILQNRLPFRVKEIVSDVEILMVIALQIAFP